MASEWFYARDGQKHGPYSSPQLRAMAQAGDLLRTDLIWREGMADWRAAGETTQLFAGVREGEKAQSKAKVAVAGSGGAEAKVPQPKGFKATAQAAARATLLAAERTKLTTITLPAAYLELGKHCYDTRAFASDFPEEMSELNQLEARLSAEAESTNPTSASSWSDRARALAGKGLDFAQKQKAAIEKATALRRLGKLAYEKYGSDAGPDAVVHPIATALARLAEIESLLGGTDSERRRWRLWHVAAAIMGVSFAVGSVKELVSDKATPGTPSVSDSAEPVLEPRTRVVDAPYKSDASGKSDGDRTPQTLSRVAVSQQAHAPARKDLGLAPQQSVSPHGATQEVGDRAALTSILRAKQKNKNGPVKLYSATDDITRVLHVVVSSPVRGSDLQWLKDVPHVERLDLLSPHVSSWSYLQPLSQLRILMLDPPPSSLRIPADALAELAASWPKLEALSLSAWAHHENTDDWVEPYMNAFAAFPQLRFLRYSHDGGIRHRRASADAPREFTVDCVRSSFSRMSRLEVLAWRWHSQQGDGGILEACEDHPTLKVLDLTEVGFPNEKPPQWRLLQSCRQLEVLMLSSAPLPAVGDVVKLKQLKELWVPKVRDDAYRIALTTQRPEVLHEWSGKKDMPTFEERLPALSKPTLQVVLDASGQLVFLKPKATGSSGADSDDGANKSGNVLARALLGLGEETGQTVQQESLRTLGYQKGVALAEAQMRILKNSSPQMARKHYQETTLPMKMQMAAELKEMVERHNQNQVEFLTGQLAGFSETLAGMDKGMRK
jgi:hypothetical protein